MLLSIMSTVFLISCTASQTTSLLVTMIVINGKPDSFSNYSNPIAPSATWDECVDYCFNMASCIAVYDKNCEMYEVGQIDTAIRVQGERIAFKILVDNSTAAERCPSDDSGTKTGQYYTNTTYRSYTVTYSNPTWTFNYPPVLRCPTNFTLFTRPLGLWCMRVFNHYACCNRTIASFMCATHSSQLSGVENREEFDFIHENSIPILANILEPVNGRKYAVTGVWVDANRTQACWQQTTSPCNTIKAFSFEDPTLSASPMGYIWIDSDQPNGLESPADGIVFRMNSNTSYGMDDTRSGRAVDGSACWKGYACGVAPS